MENKQNEIGARLQFEKIFYKWKQNPKNLGLSFKIGLQLGKILGQSCGRFLKPRFGVSKKVPVALRKLKSNQWLHF